MKNNSAVRIMRWVLVPVVAVLAAVIGSIIHALLAAITVYFRGSDLLDFFVPFINSAIFAGMFVYAGAKVAPTHNKRVALVLTILFWIGTILLSVYGIFFDVLRSDPVWVIILSDLVALTVSVYAYFQFPEED